MDIEIIPTILTDSVDEARRKLKLIERVSDQAGLISRVQIDVIDSSFADNKTLEVEDFLKIGTSLGMDMQLMVENPASKITQCDLVGVERVYGHVEQMPDQAQFVDQVVNLGMEVGLGLDIHTPVVAIKDMLAHLDAVLLMSVEVGWSGQEFNREVLKKITELRDQDFGGDICIDGGLDSEEIKMCWENGANHFAVNSALWGSGNLRGKLEELKRIE